jgi:dihydrofolate reductase
VEGEYIRTTGAVLGGRKGWDRDPDARPYSEDWKGRIFVLTHHPEDATPADGVTFLNCDVAEAVRIGLEAADGIRLFDNPGGRPIRLRHAHGSPPFAEVDVRYHPAEEA